MKVNLCYLVGAIANGNVNYQFRPMQNFHQRQAKNCLRHTANCG